MAQRNQSMQSYDRDQKNEDHYHVVLHRDFAGRRMREDSAGVANLSRPRSGYDFRGEECCATDQRAHAVSDATLDRWSMIFSENRFPPSDQVQGHAFPDRALAPLAEARYAIAIANGLVGRHACLQMVLCRSCLSALAAGMLPTAPQMIAKALLRP
jgi:hypothetical protein